jgi:hypothetical protein
MNTLPGSHFVHSVHVKHFAVLQRLVELRKKYGNGFKISGKIF